MRPDDDERLAQSIVAAFDAMAAPSAARLKEIEERLVRRVAPPAREKRSRAGFWWLFGALVVSGAAAWWSGDYFSGQSSTRNSEQRAPTATVAPERSGAPANAETERQETVNPGSSDPAKESTRIYRREAY